MSNKILEQRVKSNVRIQQDSAPAYRTRDTMHWFEQNDVGAMEWPPYLNPFGQNSKTEIAGGHPQKYFPKYRTVLSLGPLRVCGRVAILSVIAAKGWCTKY